MKKKKKKKPLMNEYQKETLITRKINSKVAKFKNEVFEIKATEQNNYHYTIKLNGKILSKHGIYDSDEVGKVTFHNFDCKPKQLFNFDGRLLPDTIVFKYAEMEDKKRGNPFLLTVNRNAKTIKFDFFFNLQDEETLELDSNPFKHIILFYELVKNYGYDIDYQAEINDNDCNCNINIEFPAKGKPSMT